MTRAGDRQRRTAPPQPPADAAQARRARAREEPLDVSWIATEPYLIALVRNPLHGTRYRVYAPDVEHLDAALCTCPDFAHRGAETCKHVEAVRMVGREAPAERVPGSPRTRGTARKWWEAFAQRRSSLDGLPTLAQLRREGRALLDDLERPGEP